MTEPKLVSDKDAGKFLKEELADYLNPDDDKIHDFEFRPKDAQINLRISKELLESVKRQAADDGVSCQKYIRLTLEQALNFET